MAGELVHFTCPACGAALRATREMAGRRANCRHCKAVLMIPAVSEAGRDKAAPASAHPPAPRPKEAGAPDRRSASPAVQRPPQSPAAAPEAAPILAPPVQYQVAPPSAPTTTAPLPPTRSAPGPREGRSGGSDMAMILRWISEGLGLGFRFCVTLALAGIVVWILSGLSASLCYVPWIFVAPPLVGGLILLYVRASRCEPVSVATVFSGFSEGRYWPSMGVFWLSALINFAASTPTMILFFLGLGAGIAAIAKWGAIGMVFLVILVPLAFAPVIYLQSRLIWSMPLVLDGRLGVTDAFGASWRLTGQILKGFGMFVMLILLFMFAVAAAIAVFSISTAVFVGGAGVTAGGVALQEKKLAEEMGDLDFGSEPRPGETPQQQRERVHRAFQRQQKVAAGALSGVLTAMLIAGGVWIVLSSLLGAVVVMPVFVGYRDMAPSLDRGPPGNPPSGYLVGHPL